MLLVLNCHYEAIVLYALNESQFEKKNVSTENQQKFVTSIFLYIGSSLLFHDRGNVKYVSSVDSKHDLRTHIPSLHFSKI